MSREADPTNNRDRKRLQSVRDERDALELAAEVNDLRLVMQHDWGRRLVWRLLARGNLMQSRFSTTAAETWRLEGQADFAIRTATLLRDHLLDFYQQMEREHIQQTEFKRESGSRNTN